MFASKGGGITAQILVETLKYLDKLNVFPRDTELPSPSLSLDGHGSRLAPVFIQYVNNVNKDMMSDPLANHYWNCALGLSNSTCFWQIVFGKFEINHRRMAHSSFIVLSKVGRNQG